MHTHPSTYAGGVIASFAFACLLATAAGTAAGVAAFYASLALITHRAGGPEHPPAQAE